MAAWPSLPGLPGLHLGREVSVSRWDHCQEAKMTLEGKSLEGKAIKWTVKLSSAEILVLKNQSKLKPDQYHCLEIVREEQWQPGMGQKLICCPPSAAWTLDGLSIEA
jgi:hypothetical protein